MTQDKFRVYYIAGAGKSGSTILDIILGNNTGVFSAGELKHLISNGFYGNEYCSCNKKLTECEFWSSIINEWKETMQLSIDEYQDILNRYNRNKATFQLLVQLMFPTKLFKKALIDTFTLYEIIARRSGSTIIIDSSKSAQRILFLRKAGIKLNVILLIREFSQVLNSNKKVFKKNIEKGIEKDFKPLSTLYVFITWFLDTVLPWMFSIGIKLSRIHYRDLINNPSDALKFTEYNSDFMALLAKRGPFNANHLCAGNRMRLQDTISLNSNLGYSVINLSKSDKRFLKLLSALNIH